MSREYTIFTQLKVAGIFILKQFAFCKMQDAPLGIVGSKENMENKSEIEKCISDCIRKKQTRLLLSVHMLSLYKRYYSQRKITMKGIRPIQGMIYFESPLAECLT